MAYSPKFRAKVALEAIRGDTTIALVAEKYGVHQVMVSRWKKQIMESAEYIFSPAFKKKENEEVFVGEERFSDMDPIIESRMEFVRDFKKEPVLDKEESQTPEPKENVLDALIYEQLGRLMVENAFLKKKIALHGE